MKRNVIFFTILLLGIIYIGCEDPVDPLNDKGSLFISSIPEEASIYIDGKNSGKKTPSKIETIAGVHQITIKKSGYADSTFVDTVVIGVESIIPQIKMRRYGMIVINSEPSGASIYIDGINTQAVTPKIFTKADGIYNVKLKYEEYADTSFDVTIAKAKDVELEINLRGEFVSYFSGVVLYDTTGAKANQPSGLNLSTGNVLNINANSGQKSEADLIFVPNGYGGYEIKTPNGTNGMFRDTRFYAAKKQDINDNENAPLEDPTWKNYFNIKSDNYVFAYTADGHYAKIKIVRVLENPKRIELRWIYNDNAFDRSF